jgi:hypothetical protein
LLFFSFLFEGADLSWLVLVGLDLPPALSLFCRVGLSSFPLAIAMVLELPLMALVRNLFANAF